MSSGGTGSGNQSSKTTSTSSQNTTGGYGSPVNNGGGFQAVSNKPNDTSTNLKNANVLAAGAANISVGKGGAYSPSTSTTTNITGIDPAAAIEAIAHLQTQQASAPGGTTVVTVPGGSSSPDWSGLGSQISNSINNALGGAKSATGYTSGSNLWLYIGGAVVLLAGMFFFFRRK